jgi:hypothetical protein
MMCATIWERKEENKKATSTMFMAMVVEPIMVSVSHRFLSVYSPHCFVQCQTLTSINQIIPAHRHPYFCPCPEISQITIYSGCCGWQLLKYVLNKHGSGFNDARTRPMEGLGIVVPFLSEVRFQFAGGRISRDGYQGTLHKILLG